MEELILCENQRYEYFASIQDHGMRLDNFITQKFIRYSRSFFKKLLEQGAVTVNDKTCTKAGYILKTNDKVTFQIEKKAGPEFFKELQIPIIYEHSEFLVINKPAGLIVHKPHHASQELSVVDWLLSQDLSFSTIGQIDRPGIVHRLDKDTSGILIIPRTNYAHAYFSNLFKKREIYKTYIAVIEGHPSKNFSCDLPIGRNPYHKTKMIAHDKTVNYLMRSASTMGHVLEYFNTSSLVKLQPLTGRTHQLRVHCAALGHPLVGDKIYGKMNERIPRHALHAQSISFTFQGTEHTITSELPEDIAKLISLLRQEK